MNLTSKRGQCQIQSGRWEDLNLDIQKLLSDPFCWIRQLMSFIGLLTATEKQAHLARLYMRPIQWHLTNHWRVPESLEKVIPFPRFLHPHLNGGSKKLGCLAPHQTNWTLYPSLSFLQRINCPKRVQKMWFQWLFLPWPQI